MKLSLYVKDIKPTLDFGFISTNLFKIQVTQLNSITIVIK